MKIVENVKKEVMNRAEGIVKQYILSKMYSEISANSYTYIYQNLNKFIYNLSPKQYKNYIANNGYENCRALRSGANYYFKHHSGVIFNVITWTEQRGDSSREWIKLSIFGKNHKEVQEKIINNKLTPRKKDEAALRFATNGNELAVKIRGFDSIILDHNVKNYLINNIQRWKNDSKWYREHNLTYKMGILLYGKPGTGKSSTIRAISKLLGNAPIYYLTAGNISMHTASSLSNNDELEKYKIVVIEDIDLISYDRRLDGIDENNNETKQSDDQMEQFPLKRRYSSSDQQMLFQLIDGVFSSDNTIYIATTNRVDSLDSGLVRAGRFDIKAELEYYNKPLAIEFVQHFGHDEKFLDELDITYPIQPSLLQSKIMEYRTKTQLLIHK